MGGVAGYLQMPSTVWVAIEKARQRDSKTFDLIFRRYRRPILTFIRNAGFGPEEAEDAVQDVFLALLRSDVIVDAAREKGRFRSLILAVTRFVMADRRRHAGRVKRGGRAGPAMDLDEAAGVQAAGEKDDPTFDRLWVQNLVQLAMERLDDECRRKEKPHYEALRLATQDNLSHVEIAPRLKTTPSNVRNLIHQARTTLKKFLLEEIRRCAATDTDYRAETEYLMKFLA